MLGSLLAAYILFQVRFLLDFSHESPKLNSNTEKSGQYGSTVELFGKTVPPNV